jgi:hypothetical protein
MTTKQLTEYIQAPEGLANANISELTELIAKYPYFQTPRILLAKAIKEQNGLNYNEVLKTTSVYAADRTLLYSFLNRREVPENLINDIKVLLQTEKQKKQVLSDENIVEFEKKLNIAVAEPEIEKKQEVTEQIAEAENVALSVMPELESNEPEIVAIQHDEIKTKEENKVEETVKEEQAPQFLRVEEIRLTETENFLATENDVTKQHEEEIFVVEQDKFEPEIETAPTKAISEIEIEETPVSLAQETKETIDEFVKQEDTFEFVDDEPAVNFSKEEAGINENLTKITETTVHAEKESTSEINEKKTAADDLLNKVTKFRTWKTNANKETVESIEVEELHTAVEQEQEISFVNAVEETIELVKEDIAEIFPQQEEETEPEIELKEENIIPETESKKTTEQEEVEPHTETISETTTATSEENLTGPDLIFRRIEERKRKKQMEAEQQKQNLTNEPITAEISQEENQETASSQPNSKRDLIEDFIQKEPHIRPIRISEATTTSDVSENSVVAQEFISENIARIYFSQKLYAKAIEVYNKLILKYPEKSPYFAGEIEKIKMIINNK